MKPGPAGSLHAVIGPQHLFAIGELDGLHRTAAGMAAREGEMARRVPVLRQHDMAEAFRNAIDHRHDPVAFRHGQRAARTEIVLHVDDQQHVGSPSQS